MNIYEEIKAERTYQDKRWGHEADDNLNTPWMWTAYITQYAGKWMRGLFQLQVEDTQAFRSAMLKVAALAVAAIESVDRQRAEKGKTFYEAA